MPCPICGGKVTASCRCFRSDSICENSHQYFYCLAHNPKRLVEGKSDHSQDIDKCMCKKEQ